MVKQLEDILTATFSLESYDVIDVHSFYALLQERGLATFLVNAHLMVAMIQ